MIRPYSCVRTSGAEKELPDAVLRPGLSYGHRRSASAPRRALVVLRTPMEHRLKKTNSTVRQGYDYRHWPSVSATTALNSWLVS